MELPEKFIKTVMHTWKSKGSAWLNQLPTLIYYFSEKWHLSNLEVFDNLSYNYVARAYSSHYMSEVVLKICVLDKGFTQEQQALQFYHGNGCVRLLAYDLENGGMLLEAIKPGTLLKTLFPHNDIQAITYTLDVIKKLHVRTISEAYGSYPNVKEWLALLNDFSSNKVLGKSVKHAQLLANNLLASQKDFYLLHGDLHHENILQSSRDSWLAIDPKGVVGELAYEVGAFIRNPVPELLEQPNAQEIIAHRFDQFSHMLAIERQRLVDWGYVQAVLAACWSLQEQCDSWRQWIKIAQLILDA